MGLKHEMELRAISQRKIASNPQWLREGLAEDFPDLTCEIST